MTSRVFDIDRPSGAISGSPEGPMPVQKGDVVLIAIARSWEPHAEILRRIGAEIEKERGSE